jgi:hypothetical protein
VCAPLQAHSNHEGSLHFTGNLLLRVRCHEMSRARGRAAEAVRSRVSNMQHVYSLLGKLLRRCTSTATYRPRDAFSETRGLSLLVESQLPIPPRFWETHPETSRNEQFNPGNIPSKGRFCRAQVGPWWHSLKHTVKRQKIPRGSVLHQPLAIN